MEALHPVTPPELSVVIPCHNESETIEAVIRGWASFLSSTVESFEIIAINDGSTDGCGRTLDKLRKELKCLRVLHQLRMGRSGAVRRGYEMARGRFILQADGFGAAEPVDFPRLWERRSEYRLVLGSRTHRLDNLLHRVLTAWMHRLLRWLFRVDLRDANAPFRLFQRYPALLYLRHLPGTTGSVDLALTVLLTREYRDEVLEVPVPDRPRRQPRQSERTGTLLSRAYRSLGDLLGLRTGAPPSLTGTVAPVPAT